MPDRPWWGEFVCSGSSAVLAYVFTNPVDVVKTRMAIQSTTNGAAPYPSVLSALYQIGRAEGVSGLQRGLYPGSFWQFSNVSVRFGVYGFFQRVAGAADDAAARAARVLLADGERRVGRRRLQPRLHDEERVGHQRREAARHAGEAERLQVPPQRRRVVGGAGDALEEAVHLSLIHI